MRGTQGRAKLASASRTCDSPIPAAANARWAATVLTPSPLEQLVTPNVRSGRPEAAAGHGKRCSKLS